MAIPGAQVTNGADAVNASPNIPVMRSRPRYYEVGSFNLAGPDPSGRVNFDLNAGLNDVATDARSRGLRPYIHHFAVRIKIGWTNRDHLGANASVLFVNLLAAMSIKTKVPLLTSYLWSSETALHIAMLDGLSVNRWACQFQRFLQAGTTRYPVNYGNDAVAGGALAEGSGSGSQLINGKFDSVTNDTWNCASMFMDIGTSNALPYAYEREFTFVIPATVKSCSRISPLYVDRLPMEIFTSSTQKALFDIGFMGANKLSDVLQATGQACAALSMIVSLDAYCVFDLKTDDFAHGVTWQSDPFAINSTGQTPGPDFYREISVNPPTLSKAITDGAATGLFFDPFDFQSIGWDNDASRVQWQVNGVNVWPSNSRNFARELVADYNVGEDDGVNPALYYARNGGNTFSSPNTTYPAPTQKNYNFFSLLGKATHMPKLPLAFTNPGQIGFAPGFFGTPGDANCALQVQLLQWALTADMVKATRSIIMAGSTNWSKQRDNIRALEVYGANVQGQQMPSYRSLLDNPNSSRSRLYEPIVAETARAV